MLTWEQEKNWPAYEQAARDFGKLRMERRMASAAPSPAQIWSSAYASAPLPSQIPAQH